MSEFSRDFAWSKQFETQVKIILGHHLSQRMMTTIIASDFEDTRNATDFRMVPVIDQRGYGTIGSVAVRLRRSSCSKRDFTIRSHRISGARTELEKIKSGLVRFGFYGWVSEEEIIEEWMLVDLLKMAYERGFDDYEILPIFNKDKTTAFIAVPLMAFIRHDAMIAETINKQPSPTLKK